MFLAAGVDGDVLIRAHQSLRVTLSTSSSVVTPARILCTPSSRMLRRQRASVALELVLAGAVVDHLAHRIVDLDELVDTRAARIALLGGRAR